MFRVEVEREEDGRWIAEVVDLPGVHAYGATRDEAVNAAKALTLRTLADRLENAEDCFGIDDKLFLHEPATIVIREPWFFKLRHTSARGIIARGIVVALVTSVFGLVAAADPGPPFGTGFLSILKGSLFGFGFGLFLIFLLFDAGSLKRNIVLTEGGVSCVPNFFGGGVDDACTSFGNWSRHEIRLLELRSGRTAKNTGRDAMLVLHPRYGQEAYMGIAGAADLNVISKLIASLPYPVEVDGRAVSPSGMEPPRRAVSSKSEVFP